MALENTTRQLIEEIKLFIQFSVPEKDLHAAVAVVERYQNNNFALRLLREYYSNLPEAREEAVVKIDRLINRQGVYLLVVTTPSFSYVYAVTAEHVLLLGEYLQPVDTEVLSFLGLETQEEFRKLCLPVSELQEYAASTASQQTSCPVCGVPEGENHLLGCTVEICPWCKGQLSYCNCRFEQLHTAVIDDEQQLETFFEMLIEKGRIPYQKSQAPAYPGTSNGLDA